MTFVEKYTERDYILSDDRRKLIPLSDMGEPRKYLVKNSHERRIVVYRVDGGVIADTTQPKCDFALWTEQNSLYFVELKGGKYSKALTQLYNTIIKLVQLPNITTKEVHARIVLSNGNGIKATVSNSHEVKLLKLVKKYNGKLVKASQQYTETI